MSFINKELYENAESQRKAAQITWEIADCLHQVGAPTFNAFPLIPYLLHKVSLYNNPFGITFKAIVDGEIEVSDDIRFLAKDILNDKLWERLLQMVAKYSPEEFALATVNPVTDNEPKGTMTTPNSILKLAHKLLDVRAGEQVADVCCGSGTYIVSAALEEPNASYHGYEINVANRAAAMMKAELLDADVETLGGILDAYAVNSVINGLGACLDAGYAAVGIIGIIGIVGVIGVVRVIGIVGIVGIVRVFFVLAILL